MIWTGWVAMALGIAALWVLPVAVTLALFRPSRRRTGRIERP